MTNKSWEFQVGVEFNGVGKYEKSIVCATNEEGVCTDHGEHLPLVDLESSATITHQPHKNIVEPVFEPCVQREVLDYSGVKCVLIGHMITKKMNLRYLVKYENDAIEWIESFRELPETTKLSDSFPDQEVTPEQVEQIKKILEEK